MLALSKTRKTIIVSVALLIGLLSAKVSAHDACISAVTNTDAVSSSPQAIQWTPANKEKALQIMLEGSLNVSRTKVVGRRYIAPSSVADNRIAIIAEANFEKAARYVLDNFENLAINKTTAIELNRILTNELVPEANRGDYNYRPGSGTAHETDRFVNGSADRFYSWLDSNEAKELQKQDPVALGEIVHHNIAALDAFPDGNGRLSRLFADFVLIKSGFPPAFYTDMKDYFDRGNSRSTVSRKAKSDYFREIVERGRRAIQTDKQSSRLKPAKNQLFAFYYQKKETWLTAGETVVLTSSRTPPALTL